LRRTSPITQFAVAAALEALGADASSFAQESQRLGIILCVMAGCVNYTRRFYDEVLRDPATASPLVFPETVFNAPASHLAALLGSTAMSYTLVGDPATFLVGLALGAQWITAGQVECCVVVGAEESDWLIADAYRRFARQVIPSEGAGAVYIGQAPSTGFPVRLRAITDCYSYGRSITRGRAIRAMRQDLGQESPKDLLSLSTQGIPRLDMEELDAWADWGGPRFELKRLLGDGLAAASAWQCIAGIDALHQNRCAGAVISLAGCNQHAVGARFERVEDSGVTPLDSSW
jgi:3-oxoacyl-(acyl-carrier-protein) synthase